mmetsp:Transcript_117449/g.204547  ORF Transcript_117449/g.204547 Transcript_117449/m.204547 type:complete len:248 (-) Transcript_117449:1100-1843(-)
MHSPLGVDFHCHLVGSAVLEPAVGPTPKIDLHRWGQRLLGLGQAHHKVFQGCILVPILGHIQSQPCLQDLPADEVVHGLDPAGALPIADGIEGTDGVPSVLDGDPDGVGGRLQISAEALVQELQPDLLAGGEGRVLLYDALAHADGCTEVGEALLQPQVVPPRHGRQVAVPGVSKLVQMDEAVTLQHYIIHLILGPQHAVREGGRRHVFHGPNAELGAVDDVVLAVGVLAAEQVLVEPNGLCAAAED